MEEEQKQNEVLDKIDPGREQKSSFLYFIFDVFKTFIVVMLIAFSIRYFVIQPFVVDGESMMSTFVNAEYLIAEKITYDFKEPSRGDVVIFRYPKNPETIYIKRVIGLPGETVRIKDGKVYITPETGSEFELSEKYLDSEVRTYTLNSISADNRDEEYIQKVGEKEYFVLGDNREHSSDSREWGFLPRSNIIGRVWLTVTPLNKFGFHSHYKY